MNEGTFFFLFKSEKKTDEGHLKQMREGLRGRISFARKSYRDVV